MKINWRILLACLAGLFFYMGEVFRRMPRSPLWLPSTRGMEGKPGRGMQRIYRKNMTMIVALAMKEELEKYEGIEVYLTREEDKDMSLEERAEYAASRNADFCSAFILICPQNTICSARKYGYLFLERNTRKGMPLPAGRWSFSKRWDCIQEESRQG